MQQAYDVIVVGAGSAGCAVAYRIARESRLQVLLVEAGSADRSPLIHMPMGFAFLQKPHRNNWAYQTLPEKYLDKRRIDLPRGKVLGGCSSLNGMVYVRGQKEDFDRWAAVGNRGWSYQDVLPVFKRSENNPHADARYHGTCGPLRVGAITDEFPIHSAFIEAAIKAGHQFNPDVNGDYQAGVGWFPCNIYKGRRFSSARAFLGAGKRLANLTVMTNTLVHRVLLEKGRACGVEVERRGRILSVRAHKEVILCGGAVNSPQLLELSGIGQPERLRAAGIGVNKALPGVGENLQDHWNSYIKQRATGVKSYYSETQGLGLARNLWRYMFRRQGFIANPAATLVVFYQSSAAAQRPDSQIHFAPAASEVDAKGNMVPIDAVTVAVCHLRPSSRGSVHVRSSNAQNPPAITLNYLQTESDQQLSISAFRQARDLLGQEPLNTLLGGEYEPGSQVLSDAEILSYMRRSGEPVHHLAGSCKMGSDDLAVVDERLAVHGISGLRVADASIMPELVSGNTHATCVMIGERCADFVLARHAGSEISGGPNA